MPTRREIIHRIVSALSQLYDVREAESIARMVVMDVAGVDFTHLIADYDAECRVDGMDSMIAELKRGRPVQYVLGHTEFCGFDFAVREGVLIPRPETAEMVCRIAESTPAGARILDIGTGSGAIAVSLARMVASSDVTAVDISADALSVARSNAVRNGAKVDLRIADALGDMSDMGMFDVIVSNPPYIPRGDARMMHTNVRDHEPDTALFVDDDNPLVFYRSIARNASVMLNGGGALWFEIYEKYGNEVCEIVTSYGFRDAVVVEDADMKPRIVCCKR